MIDTTVHFVGRTFKTLRTLQILAFNNGFPTSSDSRDIICH